MTDQHHDLRLLLDEHFSPAMAAALRDNGIDAVAVLERADLIGRSDSVVLRAAAQEQRVVVTADVTTFGAACQDIEDHVGVVFVPPGTFRWSLSGAPRIVLALGALVQSPPPGLGELPIQWWLRPPD